MSFLKCSILGTEKVIHYKLLDKRSNNDLKETKFQKQSVEDTFYTAINQNNRKIQIEN